MQRQRMNQLRHSLLLLLLTWFHNSADSFPSGVFKPLGFVRLAYMSIIGSVIRRINRAYIILAFEMPVCEAVVSVNRAVWNTLEQCTIVCYNSISWARFKYKLRKGRNWIWWKGRKKKT